ncbi:uncharacterized protein DFL_004223 [Arthrobotrys flagrans]|uniref:Uncharacterized protein n=1 Tax=Arthrobotrys flagrans TaxID=97331 RepID=A0A437A424_ARTFL|nr:hypothetical protein DFL_004223 [Arthrobotrys flagrans]
MQLLKFVTLLGLTGTALALPNANPEPQRVRQCTTYFTLTRTVTIAPTVTIPAAIVAKSTTINCGTCVLHVRTRVITSRNFRASHNRGGVKTVIRKSTATSYHPVCRTQAALEGRRGGRG